MDQFGSGKAFPEAVKNDKPFKGGTFFLISNRFRNRLYGSKLFGQIGILLYVSFLPFGLVFLFHVIGKRGDSFTFMDRNNA